MATEISNATFVILDPKSGAHLRHATAQEQAEFEAVNVLPFDRPTVVSTGALVDIHNGPGIWFGGAGF